VTNPCYVTGGLREVLLRAFSPEAVAAIEALVEERVAAALAAQPNSGSPWLSLEEAARYVHVSERTLSRMIERGRLRSTCIGRRRLVHRDDLDAVLKAAAGRE
jgi:excisionase family DNA binding protein